MIGSGLSGRRLRHNQESLTRAKRAEGWENVSTTAGIERESLTHSEPLAISSDPATFTIVDPATTKDVEFAVPDDEYTRGTWRIVGTSALAPAAQDFITTGGAASALFAIRGGAGAFDQSIAVTADQLVHINAAAGGDLAAVLTMSNLAGAGGEVTSITSLTLTLEGPGTVYPIFILGVDDPDDPNVDRWVP